MLKTFPYLRFQIDIIGPKITEQLFNIKRWRIHYTEVSEGTVTLDNEYMFKKRHSFTRRPSQVLDKLH